jgi:uncharacterized protein (DUF1778 family)
VSTLSLRLPDSLHRQIRDLAKREGMSINQFLATAAAEKMAAVLTAQYLEGRARRGSRSRFKSVLGKVPGRRPAKGDELP